MNQLRKVSFKKNTSKGYKQKIYALCRRVRQGDEAAAQELQREIEKSSLALWAVKHWLKISKRRPPAKKDAGKIKKKRTSSIYFSAFKPLQGGAPGLGKRS